MEYLSIAEGLLFWELQGKSVEAARGVSNLLIALYAISYIVTNKGCFFAVFLFDEVISHSIFVDTLSESQYYLMVSLIYCHLYWYIERKNMRLKTIVACGIIVLFNAGMSLDAKVNSEIETIIYSYYIYFIIVIHLYLISTLFRWEFIGRGMEHFIRAVVRFSGVSDAFTFIWYTSNISKT